MIEECVLGGCRHFAPRQILQQPCAGLWLIPPAFPLMLETTRKRTSKQQANNRVQQARAEPSPEHVPGTFHVFSLSFALTFLWRYRNKLRSSSQVSAAAAAAAWPVRLLLLLRDVASLPRSWWRGESAQRCTKPARSFGVTARRSVWERVQAEGRRSEAPRAQRVWWMSLGFLEGWRVDAPAAFRDSSESRFCQLLANRCYHVPVLIKRC